MMHLRSLPGNYDITFTHICVLLFLILISFLNLQFYFTDKIVIKFGEYYRPKRMAFWKSSDFGKTYQPWNYYVTPGNNPTSSQQCEDYFKVPEHIRPNSADDVLCLGYTEEVAEDRNQVVSCLKFA